MPKKQTDKLIQLISTMTKAEKRSFRLFVNRDITTGEKMFFKVFEVLDKFGALDEQVLLSKVPKLKKSQLSNVKANLYKQILGCLRLLKRNSVDEIRVREMMDYAKILYDKGLYKPCLEILNKAKKLAISINYETLVLSILYFEKRIESQHVTGSMAPRAKELSDFSESLIEDISLTNKLSNLSLMLYGKYLQYGYVKNKRDFEHLKDFFESHKPEVRLNELNFYQKLYLMQSHVWFHNTTQNFPMTYKFANRWLDLFHDMPDRKFTETPLYLKGLHNVLNALFMAQKEQRFLEILEELENFDISKKSNLTGNDMSMFKMVTYTHSLNKIFLTCRYDIGVTEIDTIINDVAENNYNWDLNRLLVFNYKLACVHFGDEQCGESLEYLNRINNHFYPSFREDIQCFSRILSLIVHFDLGNEELVNYQLRQVYRFLLKLEELDSVLSQILIFLRRTPKMKPENMKQEFLKLRNKLQLIKKKRFEKRPFLYLDIISWLDSKIEQKTFQQVLLEKRIHRIEEKDKV